MKFHPVMKLVSGWNHPCLWLNVSYRLPFFAEMKFHPVMNSSLSKRQRWNFTPGWRKGKKRRGNTSSRDEILKWTLPFLFLRSFLNMLSKVNMFEHNETMDVMKRKASLWKVKSEEKKNEWAQVKNQNCNRTILLFLLFSLWSLEKIKVSFCFNLLPLRNVVNL